MPTSNPLRICFAVAEVAPFAKTGGLADVSAALPRTLHELGHDVRIFMPLYSGIVPRDVSLRPVESAQHVPVALGSGRLEFALLETTLPDSNTPVYMIQSPLYDRGAIYTAAPDEHLRFLMLQHAVLESCQRLRFAPQIMHCNDWHASLLPLLLKTRYAWDRQLFGGARTLLSIHNIGYQGIFSADALAQSGIAGAAAYVDPADLAAGRINWLREGIRHADAVATVSPTYAREICTPEGGYGLDATLRRRSQVAGILNGVDYRLWNPATDTCLPRHYDAHDLSGKQACKLELLGRAQLDTSEQCPVVGLITRLAVQKGIELLFDSLPAILSAREVAFVVLGSGEPRYEDFFRDLQSRFPGRVSFTRAYDEPLAHLIEAGADLFLMPSLYEPCGLNQMYSLKYGTVPIVRRTGGLADSVEMWNPATGRGTGVVFNDFDAPAVIWALNTALDFFKDRAAWRQLMRNGMTQDYSWEHQAREYVELYRRMLLNPRS